ncbi:MAG: hypothetical protein FWF07_01860 [Methanomassiliicoccaceae archaeon]|nr:hypothetical protein [Methanomassiliicoccaceae archaeon]
MKMIEATSLALRICLFTGAAVLIAGLLLSETEYGHDVLWTGALILILSPFVGILTSYSYLIKEKDWKWARVATVLTALIVVFLIFSIFRS